MPYSLFDHPAYKALLCDPEIDSLFSPSAEIRAMMLFEGAIAQAQAKLEIIPQDAADTIERSARDVLIDPSELSQGTLKDGLPAPTFVRIFRDRIANVDHAQYLHWGLTSQDVIDSGLTLRLKKYVDRLDNQLLFLIQLLKREALGQKNTPIAARTRGQIATPTTLGAKIAVWCDPFERHRNRLAELSPRLLVVSCAGASGNSSVMGDKAPAVSELAAKRLGLGARDVPWHASRDAIWEFASVLGGISGSLGKMGSDLLQLSQSELREVFAGTGGASSTMPHKSNPVGAETLVALARYSGAQAAGMHPALLHAQERDGAAWMQEWLLLPGLCAATAGALKLGTELAGTLQAKPENMLSTIDGTQGFMFAEAATFELAKSMPRPEAQALVKDACEDALGLGTDLRSALEAQGHLSADWDRVFAVESAVGIAPWIAALISGEK